MLFSSIGTLGSYMKNMQLQQKWMQRQETFESRNPQVSNGFFKQVRQEQERYDLQALEYKLRGGGTLTQSELDYLRLKSPELYQKALRASAERKAYEQQLSRCRTKEEVRALRARRTASLVAPAKDAERRQDLSASMEIEMRANGLARSHAKFIRSKEYGKLPENWDELKAAEEEKKKEAAKGEAVEAEPLPAEPPEEPVEPPKDTPSAQQPPVPQATEDTRAEPGQAAAARAYAGISQAAASATHAAPAAGVRPFTPGTSILGSA